MTCSRKLQSRGPLLLLVCLSSIASAAHSPVHAPSGFYFGGTYGFGYYQPSYVPCGSYYYQPHDYRRRPTGYYHYYKYSENGLKYCTYWH